MSPARTPAALENQAVQSMLAKRRRTGTCQDCGTTTRYAGAPGKPISNLCVTCANARRRKWDEQTVIAAIHRFATEHGRPPVAKEWLHKETKPDYAPYCPTVQIIFGTWAAAIVAAGYPQPRIGSYQRNPRPNDHPHLIPS